MYRLLRHGLLAILGLSLGCGSPSTPTASSSEPIAARDARVSPAFSGTTATLRPGWNALGMRGLPLTTLSSSGIAGFAYWDGTVLDNPFKTGVPENLGGGAGPMSANGNVQLVSGTTRNADGSAGATFLAHYTRSSNSNVLEGLVSILPGAAISADGKLLSWTGTLTDGSTEVRSRY